MPVQRNNYSNDYEISYSLDPTDPLYLQINKVGAALRRDNPNLLNLSKNWRAQLLNLTKYEVKYRIWHDPEFMSATQAGA